MRPLLAASLAFGALTAVPSPAPAGPPTSGPEGVKCGFHATSSSSGPDHLVGRLYAGPLRGHGLLTCAFHIDGSGKHDDSASLVQTESALNSEVVAVHPRPLSYYAPENSNLYVCTSWTPLYGGSTLYWIPADTSTFPAVPGYWHASATPPNKRCGWGTRVHTGPIVTVVRELTEDVVNLPRSRVDFLVGRDGP